jgi:hypothetical protein
VYDMCKALDKGIEISELFLLEKTGGKSGDYLRALQNSKRIASRSHGGLKGGLKTGRKGIAGSARRT